MANIKVRDLADTTNISMANQLMVLTNEQNNIVQNITVENFNAGIISSESDNGLSQDDNGKLFVNNADSGVVAGTYEYPKNLQVNSKGQILSVEQGQEANVPIATYITAGIVKPDGLTIEITQDGTISSNNLGNEVGDIIWRLTPSKDAGKSLLDGKLLQYGSYKAVIDEYADLYADNPNANYFTDEATWQATVAQYGACGKFVYDSTNNTLRLPKVTGIVEGTIDATALGDLIAAGLPNIVGMAGVTTDNGALMTGAFSWTKRTNNLVVYNPSGSYPWGTLTLDASQSSPIYGNSSTVQPQTIKGYYYIVVATSTKTDIQVDIDEIATDLNGKADVDLTNCTRPYIIESYSNGTTWYRKYSDGWLEQGWRATSGGAVNATVAIPVPYRDTNYTCVGSMSDPTDLTVCGFTAFPATASTVYALATAGQNAYQLPCNFYACGFVN